MAAALLAVALVLLVALAVFGAAGCGAASRAAPAASQPAAADVGSQVVPEVATVSSGAVATRIAPESEASSTSTTTTLRRPLPERPLVVWVAGDSLVAETGAALAQAAERLGVMRVTVRVRDCSGLSRPDFFDWPALMKTDMARFRPDAVVVMFGGNDAQDIRGADLEIGAFTDAWKAEYARRVGEAMDILSRGGSRVFWLASPIMRSAELSRQAAIMDAIYQREAEARESVTYVDAWKLFTGIDGAYTERLPDASGGLRLVREPDGVHLTALGGERLAAEVIRLMRQFWDLPPLLSTDPS